MTTVVVYKNFPGLDTCLQNFDVENFRYRSLGRQKLWLADNIKMYRMEVGSFVDGQRMELFLNRVQGRASMCLLAFSILRLVMAEICLFLTQNCTAA